MKVKLFPAVGRAVKCPLPMSTWLKPRSGVCQAQQGLLRWPGHDGAGWVGKLRVPGGTWSSCCCVQGAGHGETPLSLPSPSAVEQVSSRSDSRHLCWTSLPLLTSSKASLETTCCCCLQSFNIYFFLTRLFKMILKEKPFQSIYIFLW